jgi:hypothetical protein
MSFPEKGNVFPNGNTDGRYVAAIAHALRDELGPTHQAVKTVVKWTGVNERTVKNWVAGTTGPSGRHLIELVRNSETVFEAFLRLAGREESLVTTRLIGARGKMREMVTLIDSLLGQSDAEDLLE